MLSEILSKEVINIWEKYDALENELPLYLYHLMMAVQCEEMLIIFTQPLSWQQQKY